MLIIQTIFGLYPHPSFFRWVRKGDCCERWVESSLILRGLLYYFLNSASLLRVIYSVLVSFLSFFLERLSESAGSHVLNPWLLIGEEFFFCLISQCFYILNPLVCELWAYTVKILWKLEECTIELLSLWTYALNFNINPCSTATSYYFIVLWACTTPRCFHHHIDDVFQYYSIILLCCVVVYWYLLYVELM